MGDWLEVTHGPAAGTRLEVAAELAVGRLEAAPADLAGDRELSRRHARFWRAAGGELLVEDLGSANGTFVNDKRIDRPCLLSNGDRVNLGATTLVVRQDEPTRVRAPAPQATQVPGAPHPDLVPPTGPPAPPPGSPPVSGRLAPPPMRLVVLLSALLVLAVAGLSVALVTRDGGISRPVLARAPAVSPIFPITGMNYNGEFASSRLNEADAPVAATIDWGDGTSPSPGTLGPATSDGKGAYTRRVSASHTYTRTATHLVTVTVKPSHGQAQTGSNLAVVTACFCVTRLPAVLRFVDLGPVSGNVRVKPPGSTAFVPLTAPREVPVGSQLDTTHGSVVVMAGTATAKKLAQGEFDGGFFELLQPPTLGGLVQLNLQGESTASCRSGRTSRSAVLSLVHASVNGSFRTRGRYSAGTGRGAEWTTAEQCDGTLTRVQRGLVDVQNFRTGVTVAVSAGQSYLARAR